MEIPNQYDPKQVEGRLYDFWLKENLFTADPASKKEPYVIVLPPPNVTGVLHMGHALTCTLEDILIRRKRMQGYNALWVPGTDHAGIATQMVVERNLMKEAKVSRHDLGREKFLEKVWEWKKESETTILSQLRLMGCSLDWTRLTFTLDEGVSRAVRHTFVHLYQKKLLYRDEAMIQWCPRCSTALSDLEVKPQQRKGKLWQIRYVLKGDPSKALVVATTRPETLLGDTAVAVHPDDERYTAFHGKTVLLPLTGREIPVITDSYVDKEFGTGALKITPGHDPNDYQVGKRHGLHTISIFDDKAHVNQHGGAYQGLSREKAREKVLADLAAQSLLVGEKDHDSNVGTCDRCGTIVEPRVSAQWFVNAEVLAKPAIEAVRSGKIKIIPEEWEKTYFQWMENIRPWCVSRQLWWGHRIPVWYCDACRETIVSVETPKACPKCKSASLRQDEDVLDTWFSSGLWPFSTLGWPDDTADMRAFYPNSVMETGFDILFFWVARMIMLGIEMAKDIPFHTVYLHPMVRDESGQKMSKTKGNVKDPLEIIGRVGADPLRFTLAAMSVHGRDVLLSDSRIEGYRNFVNKIWNASRFVLMHFGDVKKPCIDRENEINQWILTRFDRAKKEVNQALDQYRFFDAANLLYHFVWSEYCDWFIEFIKAEDEMKRRKEKGDSTAVQVLEEALRLLHPIMPFVTEELWQKLPVRGKEVSISVASYPGASEADRFPDAEKRIGRVIDVVEALRSKRGEYNVAPGKKIALAIQGEPGVTRELERFVPLIEKLAGVEGVRFEARGGAGEGAIVVPLNDVTLSLPLKGMIDVEAETKRAQKEIEGLSSELGRAKQKLASHEFTSKAPQNVIDGVHERKGVLEKKVAELEAYLKTLKDTR